MAITIPIISEFADKGIKSAEAAFNHLRTKVGEAEGAMGKMKAGFGAAGDFIKANAASMATAAGGAIATFALKAIGDFQDLALEVDKFSNVTRIAAEESSRWVEVAGDLGIEAGAIQNSINKMNKSLASSRDEYDKLGVEIARTKDGTIDANETFIRTADAIGKIKDPAERARVATQLLGKGWTEVSEIVEMGAGSLRQALESVSGAKLIDEAEIQKAKDFRAAQDQLKDAFENVALTIGSELLPMMTDLIESLAPVADKAGWLSRAWKVGFGAMTGNVKMLQDGMTGGTSNLDDSINEVTQSFWEQQQQMYRTRYEALKLTEQFDGLSTEWDIFLGKLDQEEAWNNLIEKFKEAEEAAWTALAENTPQAYAKAEEARRIAQRGVGEYIAQVGNIPAEKQTQILALTSKADFDRVEKELNYLARQRYVNFIPIRPGDTPSETTGRRSAPAAISGFNPTPVQIASAERIGGRYSSITVNVMGSVTTESDLIETVRQGLIRAQRDGSQLVYSNV